jgi:hypothetical protein
MGKRDLVVTALFNSSNNANLSYGKNKAVRQNIAEINWDRVKRLKLPTWWVGRDSAPLRCGGSYASVTFSFDLDHPQSSVPYKFWRIGPTNWQAKRLHCLLNTAWQLLLDTRRYVLSEVLMQALAPPPQHQLRVRWVQGPRSLLE